MITVVVPYSDQGSQSGGRRFDFGDLCRVYPARFFDKDMLPSLHSPECNGRQCSICGSNNDYVNLGVVQDPLNIRRWRTVRCRGSKAPRAFLVQIARVFQRTGRKRTETSLADQAATYNCKT